ncbi:SixA phosphatase family protein [Rhizomonospora bruguierae]|uniref:SixA phosphatase family protein n=1 Tax=Rhizomonospora bruguierae TaxID=1581705 RepID=UPI001BCD6B5A|nr:histidine phosphatase family protein [Micromonospora sp. NBRC 107566]
MTDRSLVLLRHAKAEQAPNLPDEDRPLTARGLADSTTAGAWLARRGYLPALVLCSPARRTRQTWHGVAVAFADTVDGAAPEVRYQREIYGSATERLLALVRAAPATVATILLVGHNPAISQLSTLLDPDGTADSDGLRTAGIAVHGVTGSWAECTPGAARLVASHTARG